jgi:hypothetical protein
LFIDKNRLIRLSHPDIGRKGEANFIELYDLASEKGVRLAEIRETEGTVEYKGGGNHLVLKVERATPEFVFATDGESLYYGYNDRYEIHKIGFDGRPMLSFSIADREKNSISDKNKRMQIDRILSGIDSLPENVVKEMASQIPDRSPYYYRIMVGASGVMYVLLIDFQNSGRQGIDVFAPDGEYIHRGILDFSDRFVWLLTAAVSFSRGELFLFAEDHEGERRLVKYRIVFPE